MCKSQGLGMNSRTAVGESRGNQTWSWRRWWPISIISVTKASKKPHMCNCSDRDGELESWRRRPISNKSKITTTTPSLSLSLSLSLFPSYMYAHLFLIFYLVGTCQYTQTAQRQTSATFIFVHILDSHLLEGTYLKIIK